MEKHEKEPYLPVTYSLLTHRAIKRETSSKELLQPNQALSGQDTASASSGKSEAQRADPEALCVIKEEKTW